MDDTPWHDWFRARMREMDLSDGVLGQQIGRGHQAVLRWRTPGWHLPPSTTHELIAAALGVTATEVRLRVRDEKRRRAVHATQPSASVPA